MVRILSSGEIVPDNDPRARGGNSSSAQSTNGSQPQPRQGFVQHDNAYEQQQQYGQVSFFDGMNQRLSDMGIPRWNLGPYVVEPIVSAGFLLALLLIGFRGLLFAGLLFFVVKYSQSHAQPNAGWQGFMGGAQQQGPPPPGDGQRGNRPSGGGSWSGSGHRLGR